MYVSVKDKTQNQFVENFEICVYCYKFKICIFTRVRAYTSAHTHMHQHICKYTCT